MVKVARAVPAAARDDEPVDRAEEREVRGVGRKRVAIEGGRRLVRELPSNLVDEGFGPEGAVVEAGELVGVGAVVVVADDEAEADVRHRLERHARLGDDSQAGGRVGVPVLADRRRVVVVDGREVIGVDAREGIPLEHGSTEQVERVLDASDGRGQRDGAGVRGRSVQGERREGECEEQGHRTELHRWILLGGLRRPKAIGRVRSQGVSQFPATGWSSVLGGRNMKT